MRQHTNWSSALQLWRAGLYAREGLILGKHRGRLLRQNGPEHCLVVATTQSGKTSNFVLPNLLTWTESVLIHDAKAELFPVTAGWRGTFSRVVCLSPTSSTSGRYNLLDAIRIGSDQEIRDVHLVSEMLTDPEGRGVDRHSSNSQHFIEMATEAIGGLILYGLYTQRARSLAALNAWVVQEGFKTLMRAMRRYPHPAIQRAAMVVTQTDGRDESSGIFSTTTRTLRLYTDPLVARATDTSDFTLRDLRERPRPMSLYLSVPFGDQERLRPWTRLVMRQMLDYCVSTKEGWAHKILGMIDEVPGLHRFQMLTEGLNYFAGYGVRLALITPSMEELVNIYGGHHNFLEGCKIKLIFGMEDAKVADTFSHRVGKAERRKTRQTGKHRTTERVQEPLLSGTALMHLAEKDLLVIVGRHKVIAQKTYYSANRTWKARSRVA